MMRSIEIGKKNSKKIRTNAASAPLQERSLSLSLSLVFITIQLSLASLSCASCEL